MKHAVQRLHFVGIGGAGMSGIAEILHNLGFTVSGSDAVESATTERLRALGLRVEIGHAAPNIGEAQALVTSTAVAADNPEVQAARVRQLPVVPRAIMLAELMRLRRGIAIAGTHGKTTTTSLVTAILVEAGLDPTFVIGGKLNAAGANSRLGQGEFIVVEADESDASFLKLSPVLAVVTNIDEDHMDTYGHSVERLHEAFVEFLHRMPFYGAAVVCADDPGVQAVLGRIERPVVSYGLSAGVSVRAVDVQALADAQMRFTCQREACEDIEVLLNLAGEHNVRNALAAIAIATELDCADADILKALANFSGVGRRFEKHGEWPAADGGRFALIDDYGHHPVEMAAVLAAARGAYPGRRLVLAFQPHRYTRTRDCFADFVRVMRGADVVLLTEVYSAGEAPVEGATGAALAEAVGTPHFVPGVADMPAALAALTRDGDVVIGMGAGSMSSLPGRVAAHFPEGASA
ncbi:MULTISPECIES: UDP-N-acetylmuramate--L-alanine ligase [unclassified Roseateles]|uniref:UDP-N-acetylmuramate--L-alanine ligase n=1 Tax=unclassified Roseateles TaxID=2626991 RepID=UPI0006F6E589|nr:MULTISPECIES: UDP-N-acetylmuramate--L-alanine ligase [unclassified Roseateles]KQW51577.1 UDP-N-acetylmuramate--alanine ligase [Pelomonas sp. Root405]KRA77810.1 UDP-N-acetylmuramate--alanine ligase [Pelomonas sp. Root662]